MASKQQNIDLAYLDYKNGMKKIDIAKKYGVSDRTIRSWSNKYDWDNNYTEKNDSLKVQTSENEKEIETILQDIHTENAVIPKISQNLYDSINSIKNEFIEFKNEISLLNESLDLIHQLKSEIIQLKSENEQMDLKKNEYSEKYYRLKNENTELQNKYLKLESENIDLKEDIIRLSKLLIFKHDEKSKKITNDVIQKVLELHNSGQTQKDIAKRIGISIGSVNNIIKKSL